MPASNQFQAVLTRRDLTGHGDAQVQELLPATVAADRVALVGLHAWAEDDIANVADIDAVADVVGITVAEFIPRQVMHLQRLLTTFPLLRASGPGSTAGLAGQGSDRTVDDSSGADG